MSLAAAVLACGLLAACYYPHAMRRKPPASLGTQPPPSQDERYCARNGSAREGVLYFGQSASRGEAPARGAANGDPLADLEVPGPQWIGRLDMTRKAVLRPLDVTAPGARSGVWDVLAHPNGRIYYTTFAEEAGWVDPADGRVERFSAAGPGLAELAPGPEGGILVSRYSGIAGDAGSVLVLAEDGAVLAEHPLEPVPGHALAARNVAWDPVRRQIWVTTDLIPMGDGPVRHDTRILAADGSQRHRFEEPEVQLAVFRADGVGVVAEVDARGLWLRVLAADDTGDAMERGVPIHADEFFERESDFVQDIQFAPDGRALAMRWSGRFHVLDPSVPLSLTRRLPRGREGRFQTAVIHGERICATLCRDVTLVCRDGTGF